MTSLLLKLFIKNFEDVKNKDVRGACGKLSGIVGIIVNILLSIGKIICGIVFSSMSIMADGLNNLSDATSSVVTFIGFKLSGRPADKEHPFGHARMEYVSGLAVSFFIVIMGFEVLRTSIGKIINPAPTVFSTVSVIILIVSIITKLWLYFFNRKMGKLISSNALLATAIDSRNDVIVTSAVLICGIIINFTSFVILDAIAGLLISVFIMVSGLKLANETLSPLLGEAPNEELVAGTLNKLKCYEGVLGVHDLVVHDYGPGRCFASVHVEMDAKNDIMESHDICDNIERDFAKEGIQLVVHLDPIITDDEEINSLRRITEDIISSLDLDMGMHDFRVVKGYTHINLIFDISVSFDCKKTDDELVAIVSKLIKEYDEKLFAVINVDRIIGG